MGQYNVTIRETLEKSVEVEASSYDRAKETVKKQYKNGDIVLYPDDFKDVSFSVEYAVNKNKKRSSEAKRLFVDMDGTLAVFNKVEQIEDLYKRGYFRTLTPNENVVKAIRDIKENHPEIEVKVLSAYLSDSKYALDEKNEWLDEYLPEIPKEDRIFPPCGKDKSDYVPGGYDYNDYLLDDYTKNLILWSPPGQGIKLLNGINHTHKTWKGNCIDFNSVNIADEILKCMNVKAVEKNYDNSKREKNKKDKGFSIE